MEAAGSDNCTRPGTRVVAACDLPTGNRGHAHVLTGTPGEIVHTPAHFSTAYSIRFDVHGTTITLHRINRHAFRIVDEAGHVIEPGFPPTDRFPQPVPRGAGRADAPSPSDDDAESA